MLYEVITFKDYLRRGGKRSFLIKVNILYTFIIKGLNIAIGFLLVPITLGYLNEYRITSYNVCYTKLLRSG